MGAPMARNLAGAGQTVRAWNRTAAKAEGLGATVAGSPAEAVEGADVVITMLADGRAVAAAMEGVTLTAEQVWWQCSTVGVEWIAKLAGGTAAQFVDGPVMGTKAPAEQGQLTVLAAGAGREQLADVFEPVAAKVVDLGDEVGAGTQAQARPQQLGDLVRREPGGDDRAGRGPRASTRPSSSRRSRAARCTRPT